MEQIKNDAMDQALRTMIENMPERTGKSLEEWKSILKKKGFQKHGEAMKFLKSEHGVTHGFANTIIQLSKAKDAPADLIAAQYDGKEELKPIYDQLKSLIEHFGNDVKIVPKKSSVSFIRAKQFALVKPATKSRIDLGLKIKDQSPSGKLENSGPFGTMCTHRIQLKTESDIDDEVTQWIQLAYDQSV